MSSLLVLDIDGTVAPSSISGSRSHRHSPWQGHFEIPDRILGWFDRYQVVWLTSWELEARDLAPALVLLPSREDGEWWKGGALNRYLLQHPEITQVVWCDDDLIKHPEWRPARPGVRVHRCAPNPSRGLSDADADHIEKLMNAF